MTFMRVRSPRVPSSQACSKTVRERARRMGDVREVGSGGDVALQLAREIQGQTPDEHQKILDELLSLPGAFKIQVSPSESLALKSDLQIPWTKLRIMRRLSTIITQMHNTCTYHAYIGV